MVKVKIENSKVKTPTPKAPTSKPFYKKWWFILIIVIGVTSIIRTVSGNKSSQLSTKTDSSAKVTKSEESTETKASEELKTDNSTDEVEKTEEKVTKAKHKIGETVKVGDVEYVVNSKSTTKTVGSEYLNKTANGTYLIVNVTVKNVGKKPIRVTSDYFKILNGDAEYSDDGTAGLYANDDSKFFLSEVNPGNSITGNVVFDLSDDVANSSDLQLQVQTGAWGTQTGTIGLNE